MQTEPTKDHSLETPPATVIVLFGITGDLAKRKLLPALAELDNEGLLHDDTILLGSSRRDITADDVLGDDVTILRKRLHTIKFDPSEDADSDVFKKKLDELGPDLRRLFYLSIPPETLSQVVVNLGNQGLNDEKTRLLIEKPYGHDLASAQKLTDDLASTFKENQIYRIDHFSAKDTVQGIATFRQRNGLFDQLFSGQYVSSIYVRAHEALDIEGRADFYEQTGALRDLIQSHLLQILADTALTIPDDTVDSDQVHASKLAFLDSLAIPTDMSSQTVRGQYEGYTDEIKEDTSETETFAAIELFSTDPRWEGTSFILETGKALPEKKTDVTVTFKATKLTGKASQLVFDIEPAHEISMTVDAKVPGFADNQHAAQAMRLDLDEAFGRRQPQAYERVFYDALRGDQRLFVTAAEAMSCWRIIQPILDDWRGRGTDGLQTYAKGSNGPSLQDLH